jgi:hypothetical protein
MHARLLVPAVLVFACSGGEVKWSIVPPEELEPAIQSLAGCVGDTDCTVVIDLKCHAMAINKRQAEAWYSRPISESEKQAQPKCMPPHGETLYTPRCGARGLCVAIPPEALER